MAFELSTHLLDAKTTVKEDTGAHIITPLGVDPEESCFYDLTCALEAVPGSLEIEFVFFVSATYETANGDRVVNYFSGAETRFLPSGIREEVLHIVLSDLQKLVELTSPDTVVMRAPSEVPAKAMKKYERICTRFLEIGYAMEDLGALLGCQSWRFDKISLLWA